MNKFADMTKRCKDMDIRKGRKEKRRKYIVTNKNFSQHILLKQMEKATEYFFQV